MILPSVIAAGPTISSARWRRSKPDQWSNQSPCDDWLALDVVRHIVVMHAAMLRPIGRELSPAPPLEDDPLQAFFAARADIEAVLTDAVLSAQEVGTPVAP